MKDLKNTIKAGVFTIIFTLFSATILLANGTSTDENNLKKTKEEVAADKLASSIILDGELLKMELDLEAEGVINCSEKMTVLILNAEDEVVYEGSYNGFAVEDKKLKKYMDKADLLVNAGNVAYYMLF